jgi:hypothetical protein
MVHTDNQTCSACNALFCCDVLAGKDDCWCFQIPAIDIQQLNSLKGCLCPDCLKEKSHQPITVPIAK